MKKVVNRSQFIRKYPSLPADAVVAAGKKKGLKFNAALVYVVRSQDRSRKKVQALKPGSETTEKQPKRQPKKSAPQRTGSEAELLKLMAEVGLARVAELAEEMRGIV